MLFNSMSAFAPRDSIDAPGFDPSRVAVGGTAEEDTVFLGPSGAVLANCSVIAL